MDRGQKICYCLSTHQLIKITYNFLFLFFWKWGEEKGRPNIKPSVNFPEFSPVLLVRISPATRLIECLGCSFFPSHCLPLLLPFWESVISCPLFFQNHSSSVVLDLFIFLVVCFFFFFSSVGFLLLLLLERQEVSAQPAILNPHLFFLNSLTVCYQGIIVVH